MIKNSILPDDTVDVDAALDALATVLDDDGTTLIRRFVGLNGTRTIKINQFARHNSPHHREPANDKLVDPDDEPEAGPGQALGGPALTPDSGLLSPDCGRRTPEARARAHYEIDPDPEGPEAAGIAPSVAGAVGAMAGSLALDAGGRPRLPAAEAKRRASTRGAPIASDAQRGTQELASDPALDAARRLANFRARFDPGLVAADVLPPWARELDRLHAGGRWPWSEINAVLAWAFTESDWWPARIEDAAFFARNYSKMRGQWQAASDRTNGLAERNRAALETVLAELRGGAADGRDN